MFKVLSAILILQIILFVHSGDAYRIGVGRADCTGPPVEIVFMGYGSPTQRGTGLHTRQFSRAFIVDDGINRVVYVTADVSMTGHAIRRDIVLKLIERFGSMYSLNNVVISGSHTHSTPGGHLHDLLYDISILGFVSETYNAFVEGIFNSIVEAHENMEEGRVFITSKDVYDVSINRSPTQYNTNPAEERAQYEYNVDKKLTQMKFINNAGKIIGAFNWIAIHPTTMNNTNSLVSSDNVGYAMLLLEQEYNVGNMPGKGAFVGAFGASNLGDVSPNIMGAKCEFTGVYCDEDTSSCPAGDGQCFASGPGRDMFESVKIIGTRLYNAASELMKDNGNEVTGPIRYIHQFVDMPKARGNFYNKRKNRMEEVKGCYAALGYSFAAGTTDGPGAFNFTQGETSDNPLWNLVRDFIAEPSAEDIECHRPKPILLATGRAEFPFQWQPRIVPTQLLQIGDVFLAALPGEFTTMAGRRLRAAIRNAAFQISEKEPEVILAGIANMYSSYIVTHEEYQIQRYEGASTIFGPHTFTLYSEQFQKMTVAMLNNERLDPGPTPPYLDGYVISLTPGVIFDGTPAGRSFGNTLQEPLQYYHIKDTASATFVAGNPRNNLMHGRTYFTVERLTPSGTWVIVATDASWETKFHWTRISNIFGTSEIQITWEIPEGTEIGDYRFVYYGHNRELFGGVGSFQGHSRTFDVRA